VGPPRAPVLAVAAIALVAAAWFWPTTTLTLEWIDQGQLVYPAWRVARGDVPYRDFHHFYGPSPFLLNGALLRLDEDLLAIRVGLLAVKAGLVVLVFLLARSVARTAIALLAAAWLAALWSAPLWIYVTPYGGHYALACSLAGLVLLLRRPASGRAALAAGLCFGLATTFKQTTGLLGAIGVIVVLASTPAPAGMQDGLARVARLLRFLVLLAAAGAVVAYPARRLGVWTVFALAAPPGIALVAEGLRDRVRERALQAGGLRLSRTLGFGLGYAIPLAVVAIAFARLGALNGLVHDTVAGVPRLVDWFVPLTKPDVRTLALAATLAVAAIALRLPASAARTGLIVLAALVTAAVVTAATMRSPWGAVTLDLLRYAPLALVWASAPLALREVSPEAPRLLWWYGACATLALSPSADLPHALLLLPAVVPLLGLLLQRAWSAAGPGLVTKACVVVLAAGPLLLPVRQALVARSGAIAARPDQTPGFARATRIWDGSRQFADMQELVALLDRTVPPGAPILSLPSGQLLYFLADRPSALPRAELTLYFVAVGVMRPADARLLASEDEMLAELARIRPVLVRFPGEGWSRFASAFPALVRWIETEYVVDAAVGSTQVLRPLAG
jgi:hypothetical protein